MILPRLAILLKAWAITPKRKALENCICRAIFWVVWIGGSSAEDCRWTEPSGRIGSSYSIGLGVAWPDWLCLRYCF